MRDQELQLIYIAEEECERLKSLFSSLDYPHHLINSTINTSINSRVAHQQPSQASGWLAGNYVTRVVIPLKDQDSADIVKTQLKDLSIKLQTTIQPSRRKIDQDPKNVRQNRNWLINSAKCTSLKVTCVIQGAMLVTRAGINRPAWMAIKVRHLQYASTMTTTTRVLSLRTSLAVSKFSRNAWTNSIVLSTRCFTSNN